MTVGDGFLKRCVWALAVCCSLMFISSHGFAQDPTAAALLSQGKSHFFQFTKNGTLDAFQTFSSDYQPTSNALPEDQIRLFRAVSRLGAIFFSNATATSDSVEDLLHEFGIGYAYVEWTGWDTFQTDPGQSLANLELIDENATRHSGSLVFLDDVDYQPPADAPSTRQVQVFLNNRLIPALDASLADLGQITNTAGFQLILTPQDIPTLLNPVEIDSGDLYLFQAGLKAVKGMLQIATSYDLGLDLNWLTSMTDQDALTPDGIMGRFPDLLQLLSTSSPLPINGAARLDGAKQSLIEAINDGEQASALIRNDTQTPPGAEELLKLLPDEYDEEAFLRHNLLAFRDALSNGEAFEYSYEEQEWVLTQTSTGHTRNLWFEIQGGPALIADGDAWSSSCDFISCSSGVEDVEINGTSISMTFEHHDWNGTEHFVVCKGTLSDNGTHIADGKYYENGTLLGSFTADRTFFDQETIGLNMSRFFGDGTGPDANGPFNLSDFLPEFSAGGDPVPGTMGSGLGRDPTLGGILPDWTQQDWLEPLDFDEDGPDLAAWTEIAVYNDKLAAGFSILPSFSTFLEGAVLLGPNDFFYRFDLENDVYDSKTECSGSAGWWQEFNSTLEYGRYHLILDYGLDEDVKEVFSSELSRLDLPRVQGATMTSSVDDDGSIDFNWTPPAADLSYRVRIYDSQMNRVFKSDLFENATLHVPAEGLGCLEQNGSYQWQVRVYDPETWQHVSKSDLVDLVYDPASLGKRIVWFMAADSKGQKIVGFDVRPGSRSNVLKATVIGPDTGNGTFTHIFDLDQAWYDVSTETRTNKGWWSDAGEPLPTGQYRLEVIFADGTTENATDQFNAVTVIPVDSGTMYSQNHWDGMWFDWDVPQGGESQYYDLRIRNLDRSKEYLKRRFSGNDSGIWLSLWDLRALTPGQSYQWFIRAYDSEFPYSTMVKSASQYFTYSPLGIAKTPSTSFPIAGAVMNYRTGEGDFINLDVFIGTGDFQGNLISNVASVSISGPNNLSLDMADLEYWFDPYWNGGGFNVLLDGPPAEGEYTFSVRYTNGDVFNSTDYQGPIKEIPIPDQGQMSPGSGAVVATKPPTFSWGAVSVPDTEISYRLQIRETGGGVVFASDRQAGTLSMTVPVDTLEPGKAYEWRVRATDSSNWVEVDNRAQTDYIPFTMADTLVTSPSPPAIDLDSWGAVNYSTQDGHGLSSWLKVVDQDGISSDGSSHAVTVSLPNGTVRTLEYNYHDDSATAIFEDWSWQGNTPPPPGNYTFTVTDAGNNTFSVTDELIVNTSLGVPDESTFTPVEGSVLNDTTPTFTWSPVPGAVRYRVRIYSGDNSRTVWNGHVGNSTSWTVPPGILEPFTDYRYRIEARSEHSPLDIDNNAKGPATGDNIRFTTGSQVQAPAIDLDSSGVSSWSGDPFGTNTGIWVIVHDAQGVPDNIQSVTALTPDKTSIPLFFLSQKSPTRAAYLGWTFAPPQSGEYSIKVVDKDGNSYTKKEYLTAAPLDPPAVDSLSASFNGTAYEVNWDEVNGAAFYRLEIYDLDFNRIYRFATTKSEYSLPAGFLKSGALYRYRITSRREFFDQNVDNALSAPWSRPTLVHKPATGNNPPRITLDQDNHGVAVWHTPDPATSASDYWLLYDVLVSDPDGLPQNGVRVTATTPDGRNATLYLDTLHNATSATYEGVKVYSDPNSVPQGTYTFTVVDADGLRDTASDTLSLNPPAIPVNVRPRSGATVIGPSATIDWDDVNGTDVYRVKLYSGWDHFVHYSDYLNQSQYAVPLGILEPGKLYNYRVEAYREHYPDADYDNVASSMVLSGIRPFFRFEGLKLELDGPGFDFDTKGFTPWDQGSDLTYTTAFNATGSFEARTLIKDEGVNNLDQVDTWDHSQGGDFAPLPEVGHVYTLETDRGVVYALKVNAIQETPKAVVFAYKRLGPAFGLSDLLKVLKAQSGLAFESPPFDTNRNRRNDLGDAVFMLKELSRAQP